MVKLYGVRLFNAASGTWLYPTCIDHATDSAEDGPDVEGPFRSRLTFSGKSELASVKVSPAEVEDETTDREESLPGPKEIKDPGKKRKAPKSWKRKHRANSESSETMATRRKLERKVPVKR